DGFFLAVVLNLSEQRRHEVEGRTDLGISVQQRRHLVVVLGRSQPNPRQKVGAREVVLVIRLMHVPDEGDLKRLGHAVTSMIAVSAFGLSASWRALTAVVSLPASLPRSPRAGSAGRSPSPRRSRAPSCVPACAGARPLPAFPSTPKARSRSQGDRRSRGRGRCGTPRRNPRPWNRSLRYRRP